MSLAHTRSDIRNDAATAEQRHPPPTLSTRIALSDEQAQLLDAASSFCRERSPALGLRPLMASETGFDPAVWQAIVAMGWPGLAVPEALGGSGLPLACGAVIAEPMGRHLLATPFISTQLFVAGLLAGGNAAQQARWLPAICRGRVGSVAVFEDSGDWDLTQPACQASRAGASVTLHGHKTLVTDAGVADALLVSVMLDGAPALAVLDIHTLAPDQVPRHLQRETVIDETRRCWRLHLDGLAVAADALITGPAALSALAAVQHSALLLASAEAAGGLAGALALMVDYLNTRSAFGRKIGSYQALKHSCADLLCTLERTRSHVHHAATLMADGSDAEIALRMAKAEAGDGFVQAGDRAVQFHGGFGFTWDCDAQLYLRRALFLQPWFGDAGHQRQCLADRLWPLDIEAS